MKKNPTRKPGDAETSPSQFSDDPLTDKIGSSLKKLYDDVVNEDVPEDFLTLLAKADK